MVVEWMKFVTVKKMVLMVYVDVFVIVTEFQKLEKFL